MKLGRLGLNAYAHIYHAFAGLVTAHSKLGDMRFCLAAAAALTTRRAALSRARCIASATDGSSVTVGFVTDVEGNLDFWQRYCELSDVIEGDDIEHIRLKPGCHLVHGGDSVDKSSGDLRFLRSLLGPRRRHPDRVHFVLGNRDINKMRLLAELSNTHWLQAEQHPGVYWREHSGPNGTAATPATYLAALNTDRRGRGEPRIEDNLASRLRYMLADNMGSPRAFEHRRAELGALGATSPHAARAASCWGDSRASSVPAAAAAVSDEAVLCSYLASVGPDGLMREYLEHAQLAVRLGPALFVHGGVHADAIGVVPGCDRRIADVNEWVDELNHFAHREVRAWCDDADATTAPGCAASSWPGRDDRLGFGFFERPGGRLMAYGMARQPDGKKSPTVVYASYLADGHPQPPAHEVASRLTAAGVHALLTGHQPHGDAPVVMRCPIRASPGPVDADPTPSPTGASSDTGGDDTAEHTDELLVVTADLSFSGSVEWRPRSKHVPALLAATAPSSPPPPPSQSPAQTFDPPRGAPPPPTDDPRGQAVVEVVVDFPAAAPFPSTPSSARYVQSTQPQVRVHGTLSNGRPIDFTVCKSGGLDDGHSVVGRAIDDGRWWVKGILSDGAWLLSRGEGYYVENAELVTAGPEEPESST